VFRTLERIGVTRGGVGASKGWFYVGTGLWTLRKVRALGERKTEVLMREPLRPGDRVVIANGVATIETAPRAGSSPTASQTSRRRRRKQKRADRKALVTQADLSRRARKRAARRSS
jgi:hypothetical protein